MIGRVFEFAFYILGAGIFVVFFWGAFDMLLARGDSQKVEKGKETMKGAMWGALFVLIAWQMINLVLFILGTKAGDTLYDTNNQNPAEPIGSGPITFKLFGRPWNYLCEPTDEHLSANEIIRKNQRECFGRGDGTPCTPTAQPNGGENNKYAGVCIEGTCKGDGDDGGYGSACEYLAEKFPEYFGGTGSRQGIADPYRVYKCMDNEGVLKMEGEIKGNGQDTYTYEADCLKEPFLCANDFKCCGVIQVAK